MGAWEISELEDTDVPDFVDCQFAAFRPDNPLHDLVHPDEAAAVDFHRKAIEAGKGLKPGNSILYLKAVDKASGKLVGGVKWCYYSGSDVLDTSPYAAGISKVGEGATEYESYRQDVLNAFLVKRVDDIKGQHALIDLLFVHPEFGRQGIGSALVAQGCRLAEQRHVPVAIVEASPKGKRSYELNGFQTKEVVTISFSKWPRKPDHLYYWMERTIENRTH